MTLGVPEITEIIFPFARRPINVVYDGDIGRQSSLCDLERNSGGICSSDRLGRFALKPTVDHRGQIHSIPHLIRLPPLRWRDSFAADTDKIELISGDSRRCQKH